MQGAISNIEGLERFFRGANAPFFTLSYYSTASPTGQGSVILRNIRESDLNRAWELLKGYVQDQTGTGRTQLHLITYEKENGANTPTARTNIDIIAPAFGTSNNVPGIGYLPGAAIGEDTIQKAVDAARERWEMEARINALENREEDGFLEKVERIAAIPAVQAILNAFLQKNGLPAIPPAVNGGPKADNEEQPEGLENFDENIDATAKIIGVTDEQLAWKLRNLAEQNPEMARQLFFN